MNTAKKQTELAKTPKKRTTEADVLAYLKRRPQFFEKNSSLLDTLKLKQSNGNITSLNIARANRKEKETETLQTQKTRLYRTAEQNERAAESIFHAVEALAGLKTLAEFRKFVQSDLKKIFALDGARLMLAGEEESATTYPTEKINTLFDDAENVALRTLYDIEQRALYGYSGKMMQSDLLLKLTNKNGKTIGLLAMGSKDEQRFHIGQSGDLVTHLARTASVTLARVLL